MTNPQTTTCSLCGQPQSAHEGPGWKSKCVPRTATKTTLSSKAKAVFDTLCAYILIGGFVVFVAAIVSFLFWLDHVRFVL